MKCHNVLLKVQGAIGISVKAAEDMPSVSARVGIWKETGVDALELFLGDASGGTLFEEGGVPCAELFLSVFGVQLQVIQNLFGQSAALAVPHIPKLYKRVKGADLLSLLLISPTLLSCLLSCLTISLLPPFLSPTRTTGRRCVECCLWPLFGLGSP